VKSRAIRSAEACPFRGLRDCRGEWLSSPIHSSRLEVIVPFRVFSDEKVAEPSGSPLPVRSQCWQTHDPSGFPSLVLAQRRDSLGNPLMGFDPPSRLVPPSLPRASRRWAPLLGFSSPTALSRKRVHVPVGRPSDLPGCPGICRWSQTTDYGAARRLSQPLSGFFLSLASHRVSDGWRSWGFALQGFDPSTKPRRLVVVGMPS
jgi:hypothetical protein